MKRSVFFKAFFLSIFLIGYPVCFEATEWEGNTDDFTIVGEDLVILNEQEGGKSYLSTPSTKARSAKWSISLCMKRRATSQNYMRIYLTSNTSNLLSNEYYGYFVQVGPPNKGFSLIKQNGKQIDTLIEVACNVMREQENKFTIIVTRDSTGLWRLQVEDDFYGGSPYVGDKEDEENCLSSFAGVVCIYSNNNAGNYQWSGFKIEDWTGKIDTTNPPSPPPIPPGEDDPIPSGEEDSIPPKLKGIECLSDNTLQLSYDKELNIQKASFYLYTWNEIPILQKLSEDKKSIILSFDSHFENGKEYSLDILGVCNSYGVSTRWLIENFIYRDSKVLYEPHWGNIVFSEFMPKDAGEGSAFKANYVELYNRTDSFLQLEGCVQLYKGSCDTFPSYEFPPKTYLVLCNKKNSKQLGVNVPTLPIAYFPALADTGALLQMTNKKGELVAWAEYNDGWKADKGSIGPHHSWEVIDLNNLTGNRNNWGICTYSLGGTPGMDNSLQGENRDILSPTIIQDTLKNGRVFRISFNKPMNLSALSNRENYTLNSPLQIDSIAFDYPKGEWVEIFLAKPLEVDEDMTLHIHSLKDISDRTLPDTTLQYTHSQIPKDTTEIQWGDIVFSEVMANPKGVIGLPEVKYVELYNQSSNVLQLEECSFEYGKGTKTLPRYELLPKKYVVLCNVEASHKFEKTIPTLPIPYFPDLREEGDLLQLRNKWGECVAWVEYNETWYNHTRSETSGYSLEAIDVKNYIGDETNWGKCVSTSGGTPGGENSIKRENPDLLHPRINRSFLKDEKVVRIEFNKPMNLTDISKVGNYSLGENFSIVSLLWERPQGKWVEIYLSKALKEGDVLPLRLASMRDISGLLLPDTSTMIILQTPSDVGRDNVIFNEILFDPTFENGEFVELYNRGDVPIDLSLLYLSKRNTKDSLFNLIPLSETSQVFPPKSYRAFAKKKESIVENYPESSPDCILELPKMFALNNESGTLVLTQENGEIVDEFSYNQTMHSLPVAGRKGVSLERISPDAPTQSEGNWTSASAMVHYATPGRINSVTPIHKNQRESFRVLQEVVHLMSDESTNSIRIEYAFSAPSQILNAYLYTLNGELKATIASNLSLECEGVLKWKPLEYGFTSTDFGAYLLLLEYYSPSSGRKISKFPIVITE